MTTLKSYGNLAAVNRDNEEPDSRNKFPRNTKYYWINEQYITQVSEEVKGRLTKQIFYEFSRLVSRILRAVSNEYKFLLDLQVQVQSGSVPWTPLDIEKENQEHNEDRSQDDAHFEGGARVNRSLHTEVSDSDSVLHSYLRDNFCSVWSWRKFLILARLELTIFVSHQALYELLH